MRVFARISDMTIKYEDFQTVWTVNLANRTQKNCKKLPRDILEILQVLLAELDVAGPVRNRWPNFGKIRGAKNCYHCHLQKGNPTYVAVWRISDKTKKIIEVTYVGTHEKADYKRLC